MLVSRFKVLQMNCSTGNINYKSINDILNRVENLKHTATMIDNTNSSNAELKKN